MTWRVARSLNVLLDEVNKAAPKRSKRSDGSIGDAKHASRTSDHNPWVKKHGIGVVRARDFTNDPKNGCDSSDLAEEIRLLGKKGGHPALGKGAYVIADGRISSDSYGFGYWKKYTGTNAHTQHCHVSVTTNPNGFDSPEKWGVLKDEPSIVHPKIDARAARAEFVLAGRGRQRKARAAVRRIQRRLNKVYGTKLKVDGWAGTETRRAYKRHEAAIGYGKPDGLPGRPGLKRLFKGTLTRIR